MQRPEARPLTLLSVVGAKADQLGQDAAQLRDQGQPLPFGGGPEDGHGGQLGITADVAIAQLLEQGLKQGAGEVIAPAPALPSLGLAGRLN